MQTTNLKSKIPLRDLIYFEGNNTYFLSSNEIIYIESKGNLTYLYFSEKAPTVSTIAMKEFAFILKHKSFCRIHNSFMVNMRFLKEVHLGQEMRLELTGGRILPLSVRRKQEFLAQFNRFMTLIIKNDAFYSYFYALII